MAYYVMLCIRTWVANRERPDYPSMMTNLSYEPTKAELEKNELEIKGSVHFVISNSDESSQHIARQVVKDAINMTFVPCCNVLEGQTWIAFHSQEELFILPDSFSENFLAGRNILPINPNFVLIAESTYKYLDENKLLHVGLINSGFKKHSKKCYVHR